MENCELFALVVYYIMYTCSIVIIICRLLQCHNNILFYTSTRVDIKYSSHICIYVQILFKRKSFITDYVCSGQFWKQPIQLTYCYGILFFYFNNNFSKKYTAGTNIRTVIVLSAIIYNIVIIYFIDYHCYHYYIIWNKKMFFMFVFQTR